MKSTDKTIPFRGFDELGEVRVYHNGILPHWRQAECTYFVTFRLGDALPAGVVREIEYERNQWLKSRGIKLGTSSDNSIDWHQIRERLSPTDRRLFERTMASRLNNYLDAGHGSCVLRRPNVREVVTDALEFFHDQRTLVGDYVVMPNHVHVLMRPLFGYELEDILHSIKSYTSNVINRLIGTEGRLWMRESYDHVVRDFDQLKAFQDYIRANPEKAKLCAGEYTYRSAIYRPEE